MNIDQLWSIKFILSLSLSLPLPLSLSLSEFASSVDEIWCLSYVLEDR